MSLTFNLFPISYLLKYLFDIFYIFAKTIFRWSSLNFIVLPLLILVLYCSLSLSMRHYLLHKTERDGGCCMYMEPIKYIFHGKLQNGIAGNCHKLLLLLNLHSLFSCKNYKNEKIRQQKVNDEEIAFLMHIRKRKFCTLFICHTIRKF